jgi:hypothetical protein
MIWMDRIRSGVSTIILATVVAVSIYWTFYGSSRGLNIGGAIILALSLFSVRKRYRVLYGMIEITFGIFLLAYSWRQGRGAFSAEFSSEFDIWIWQIVFIQNFAAIYVIIRGLDNVDQGSAAGKAARVPVARLHGACRWIMSFL